MTVHIHLSILSNQNSRNRNIFLNKMDKKLFKCTKCSDKFAEAKESIKH